jgi:hypothetical protein
MQERLNWLERDLDHDVVSPVSSGRIVRSFPSKSDEPAAKTGAWIRPRGDAPPAPSASVNAKPEFWVKPQ